MTPEKNIHDIISIDNDVEIGETRKLETETIDFGKPWYRVKHLLLLHLLLLLPISAGSLNGFDAYLVNSLQIMDTWVNAMGKPSSGALGAITAGPPFGYLMALYPATVVSDKFGRKTALLTGAILTTIGTFIQGFANAYTCFLISRLIIGWGLGFYLVSAPAWVAELSFPKYRAQCVTLFNGSAFIGGIIASWTSYGTLGMAGTSYGWRIPCLSQLVVTIPHLMLIWFVPESPRFLVYKKKEDEARKILLKYHGGDDEEKCGSFIDFQLKEIIVALDSESKSSQFSFKSFFQSKANFHRFAICVFMGFLQYDIGLFAVTYYLNPVLAATGLKSAREQMLIAACLTLFNTVCAYVPSFIVGRFNRRKIFLGNLIGLFIAYVIFVALSGVNQATDFQNPNLAKGILAMVFLCYFFYDIGFLGMLLVYITEILPFARRSQGIMLYVISGQSFVIFNGFVTPVAMSAISWKFYIVYAVSIVCCGIFIYFLFPETKGYSLEETSWLFGDKVDDKLERKDADLNVDIVRSNDLTTIISLSRENKLT